MGRDVTSTHLPVVHRPSRPAPTEVGAGEAFFDAFADVVAARLADRLAGSADLEKQHHANEAASSHGAGRAVLCVAEAAELLGISRALAYDLVRRHELPSVRLGRRILVPRVAIEQLLVQAVPHAQG